MNTPQKHSHLRAALGVALALVACAGLALAGIKDRDVDSTGPDFTKKTLVIHLQGQYTSNTTAALTFKNYEDWKILKVYQVARAKSGTVTVDIKDDGTTIFSSPGPVLTTITDDSPYFTAPKTITAGSLLTVDLAVGTSVDDLTLEIVYRSKVATE